MLAKVQPDYIVCLGHDERNGMSAFSLMREKSEGEPEISPIDETVRGYTAFKKFAGSFQVDGDALLTPTVVGVLHPTYYESPPGLRKFIDS